MNVEMMAPESDRAALERASVATFDGIRLPCQRVGDDDSSQISASSSIPSLPEDILCHIHSLMPIYAAARAACLSRAFLSSWRCYPKLDLGPMTLCPKRDDGNLRCKIDSIIMNHSGIGLKILKLVLGGEKTCFPYVDNWLHVAVTPGIEELELWLYEKYNFPCSILSDGVGNSLQSLHLSYCTFHPMQLGPLRSLTRLELWSVCITGEELECLLANSLALEHLDLDCCQEIILLTIPSTLLHLSYLQVSRCRALQVIENKAPSLSSFFLVGKVSKLSLGEASQTMKDFSLLRKNAVSYARVELPSLMPNLESLGLSSITEDHTPPTPMLPTKFLNLKHLNIQISGASFSEPYDYYGLVSFLDASPSLETCHLNVYEDQAERESVSEGPLHLRQLPEHRKLKSMEIVGFKSAKTLVELTCCIVKSATSLERLTLNTFDGFSGCSGENNSDCQDKMCYPIRKAKLEEASRAVVVIQRYIEDKVPPTAKLTVVEPCPCPRCRSTHWNDEISASCS